ncbi:MAG: hypothetical protein V4722_16635 [Bacteroidota bacterium]
MSVELQKFSNNPEENFRMENEFLKMKLAAQFGGDFGNMSGNLPPEIENQFLKNVLQFENHVAGKQPEMKKVKELIGNPELTDSASLPNDALAEALQQVNRHYQEHGYNVNFVADYPDRIKYEFMTGELLEHETDSSFMMPGMICNFIYEEFHPNHAYDIEEQARKFINAWLQQDIKAFELLLGDNIPLDPHQLLTQAEVIQRIQHVFDSFVSFKNYDYIIDEVSYDMDEEQGLAMAYAEGAIKYDAIMESGEILHFVGPMKIYFALGYYWDVMFFVMPGFKWK